MKKIGIVAFFHTEASLCLAKYLSKIENVEVDIYLICDLLRDKGYMPGIEYFNAPKHLGICKLTKHSCPAIIKDSIGLPVNYHLLRLLSFSSKLLFINKLILKHSIKQIRSKHYDAINIVGHMPWVEYIHVYFKGENIIHTFHEVGGHSADGKSTPLLRKVINDGTKVILPSNSTYNRFMAIKGVNENKTANIPVGEHETLMLYEKSLDMHLNLKHNLPTLLFYGFIKPYKGLDTLAEAYKILGSFTSSFNLIIAGAGADPALNYFKEKKDVVVLNRFLTDEEMMYLNRISDVVLLPYHSASQSGIVLTSFMFGNPIISTSVGALSETINNGVNGLLVNPDSPKEFANAMKRLVTDKDLYDHLSHGALQFGHGDEYDWNNIAKKTLDFYFE